MKLPNKKFYFLASLETVPLIGKFYRINFYLLLFLPLSTFADLMPAYPPGTPSISKLYLKPPSFVMYSHAIPFGLNSEKKFEIDFRTLMEWNHVALHGEKR